MPDSGIPDATVTQPPRGQSLMYHDLMTPAEVLANREEVRAFCDTKLAPVAGRSATPRRPRRIFRTSYSSR